MTDVLDEVTNGIVDSNSVVERIREWDDRIRRLFNTIGGWLPPGWSSEVRDGSVTMNEKMMKAAGVSAAKLPALVLFKDGERRVTIEPRTLWIVGTNGRLDVRTEDRDFFIVDRAQIFERPDWRLVDSRDRSKNLPVDETTLRSILN